MGVNGSTELPKHFHDITKWPKSKVESAVKAYIDGEYDFGIDYTVVMNITGCDTEASKELVKAHSKNSSGIINALTLLISIISLGNSENRNETGRLEALFELVDFNKTNRISLDELAIFLLCLSSSYSFILAISPDEQPVDAVMIQFAKSIFETLGKRPNNYISREDIVEYAKEHIFSQGILNINDMMGVFINGLDATAAAPPSVNSSITNN